MSGKGLARVLLSPVCVLVLVAICFVQPAIAAQEILPKPPGGPPEARPSEIRGTVRINGWTGDVAHAFIHAMPADFGSSTGTQSAPKSRDVEHFNPLKRTADPHVFSFSINGLLPNTPYKLGITLPPNPIRPRERIKTFWSGLPGGMATSGMPPVAIEGYVANTEVEVKDGNGNWVGADDLQYANPETALRTLRWKSTIPGVVAGELQISLRPFPTKGNFGPCDEPEGGMIYRKQFAAGEGEWQEIGNLDFGQVLSPRPTDDAPPPGILPISSPSNNTTTGDSTGVTPISQMDYKMLALGAPLYIRIVPVIDRGEGRRPACNLGEDGVHGWVIMAKVGRVLAEITEPPPAPEDVPHLEVINQTYTPPTINKWGDDVRKAGGAVYKVIKEHTLPSCYWFDYNCNETYNDDQLGQAMLGGKGDFAGKFGYVFHEGDLFSHQIIHSSSCDFWCEAWDFASGFVTGTISGIGGFVTWWAEAFESIKDGVASVVADVVQILPGVGELCKAAENIASCKSIIKAGINYGLASMGLPPSLPNWEQLKDQGMDYLASEVSQQMAETTGLPEDLAKLALDEGKVMELSKGMAQKTITAMTENRGKAFNGWSANWVIPYDGMEPASRTIKLVKKYPGEAPYAPFPLPSNLYLGTLESGSFIDFWINKNFDPFIADLYRPEAVHVPEFPNNAPIIINGYGSSLNIPIVLQPDYSTIPVPQCVDTMPAYDVQCSEVHLLPDNPFQPNSPSCWQSYGGYSPWKLVDCNNYNTHIALYYRDYWIRNRLDDLKYAALGCLHLFAGAYTYSWFEDLVGLDPWHLFDSPFVTHAFTPSEEANAWTGPVYIYPNCH